LEKKSAFTGLTVFAGLCLLFWLSNLDLAVARLAHQPAPNEWPGQDGQPWSFLYHFGEAPAAVTAVLGLLGFILSFFDPSKRSWRGPGLYLFLCMILGPGLLVNVLGKGLLGRPRPSDLAEFGGAWNFLRPFQPGIPGSGKSFLSGHASMAFYFFSLVFLFKGRARLLALLGTCLFGALMGTARILQGGHFLSDIALCGALLFTLAACLSPLIHWQPQAKLLKRPKFLAALSGVLLGVALLGNPIAIDRVIAPDPNPSGFSAVAVRLDLKAGDIHVSFGAKDAGPLRLREVYRALALPGSKAILSVEALSDQPGWKIGPHDLASSFTQKVKGFAWNIRADYSLQLPSALPCEARLKSPQGAIIISALPKNRAVLIYSQADPAGGLATLPEGFQPYEAKGYFRKGDQPLIVLELNAASLRFE
jgi:membrane-associated PAP2 superfamily phosphatase